MDKLPVVQQNTNMEVALNLEDNKITRQGYLSLHPNPAPALFFCGDRKG
jgi:hypothetical protein